MFFPIITTVKDELDQVEEIEAFTKRVFCEKKPIAQSEFFSAGQSGIKAAQVLVVSIFDYVNEQKLKYKDKVYSIYRIYERSDEKIELYCEVKAGG
ncbi:phage head closure protein [Peribacillus sp. NPDC097284]|uniref:phage head closure protein n=1 Tax=Peribacillus sp. NPDC097284 TaxID=3364401 RepID=UPI00380C38CE